MGRERHPAPVVAALSATAGLVPDLKNPDFGAVAKAMGLRAPTASRRPASWRSPFRPGSRTRSGLLCVKVKPMQLVMPPSPFVSPETVVGMAVYTDKAILHGKGGGVRKMLVRGIP
jgi:pyruvate dehydrogenase (quinone)